MFGFAGGLAALLGAGRIVPGFLGCREHRVALRLVGGLGVLAMGLHGLGLAGLWTAGMLRSVTALAAVAGLAPLVRAARRRPGIPPALLAALAVPLALGFLLARLPDTDDDPRTYHFAAPESYLREHKIHAEPLNVNWHMPLGASMLFGAGWAWRDIEGAKLVNLAALAALMLGAAALGRTLAPGSGSAPALAALLTGCAGLGVGQAWQGKDDLVLAAHAALALWGAVTGRWAVAAVFTGFGCAVKFTGGFMAAGVIAAGGIRILGKGSGPIPPVSPLHLFFLFILPLSGWLLSSLLFVGNPVHPFLSGVFPDLGWGPESQRALHRVMAILTGAGELSAREAARGGWLAWGDGSLGHPLLLPLAITGFVLARSPARRPLAAAVVTGFGLWLATERNPRYLFPFTSILAAFGAVAVARLRDAGGRPWRAAAGVVAVVVVINPVIVALPLLARDGVPLLAGRMSRDEFLARRFTTWDDARRWTNAHVPVRSTVVFAGEERRLWFTPRVRSGFTVHEPILWRWSHDAATADRMRIQARQAGVQAVLYNFMSAEFRSLTRFPGPIWTDRQLAVYKNFAAGWLNPVRWPDRVDRDGGGFIVYRIDASPPGRPWPVPHLPQTEGLGAEAWARASRGDRAGAAAARRAAAAKLAGVQVAGLHLALAAEQAGNQDGVYRALAPVIASGFIGVNALERFGAAAVTTRRVPAGLAALSRAWRMTREDSTLAPYAYGLFQRALVHIKAGRLAKAREDLRVAQRLAPEQPAIRRALTGL